MLCHATPCHAIPRHAIPCHTMPQYDTLSHNTLCHAVPRYATRYHATLHHVRHYAKCHKPSHECRVSLFCLPLFSVSRRLNLSESMQKAKQTSISGNTSSKEVPWVCHYKVTLETWKELKKHLKSFLRPFVVGECLILKWTIVFKTYFLSWVPLNQTFA
jgi:hypothetical protein